MSTTPPADDAPKPDPPPVAPPPPDPLPGPAVVPVTEPTPPEPEPSWTRHKLPVNRKDRPVPAQSPAAPSGPKPKSNALRTALIILGMLALVPVAGCLFLYAACAMGLR